MKLISFLYNINLFIYSKTKVKEKINNKQIYLINFLIIYLFFIWQEKK